MIIHLKTSGMKKQFLPVPVMIFFACLAGIFSSCSGDNIAAMQLKIDSLQQELKMYKDQNAAIKAHLVRFDSLDFDIYSHQKWDQLNISHADNIIVTYPDGHQTSNLPTHIEALKPLFVFAPDTKITGHPVKFGSGEWTCVTGIMTGTFSKPMPIGNGSTIPPTNKPFKLTMCTVGHWKNGKMIEETLFWDNATMMKQIGVGH